MARSRPPGAWGIIALVSANLFVVGFGATWGPAVWVLLGEIFPNSIRAMALGVAAAAQWIANFIVSTTFPALADAGLALAYGIYAVAAAAVLDLRDLHGQGDQGAHPGRHEAVKRQRSQLDCGEAVRNHQVPHRLAI